MTIGELVRRLMFGSDRDIGERRLLELGFEYRARKTPEDFRHAWARGLSAGAGKVEHEEMEIANRLARVLKVKSA